MEQEQLEKLSNEELIKRLEANGIPYPNFDNSTRSYYIEKIIQIENEFSDCRADNFPDLQPDTKQKKLSKRHSSRSEKSAKKSRSSTSTAPHACMARPTSVNFSKMSLGSKLCSAISCRKCTFVSGMAAMFFIVGVCSAMYFSQLPTMFQNLSNKNPVYKICEPSVAARKTASCIPQQQVHEALSIIHSIVDLFVEDVNGHLCSESFVSPKLTLKQIYERLEEEEPFSERLIKSLQHLIEQNPRWNIRMKYPEDVCYDHNEDECMNSSHEMIEIEFNDAALSAKCNLRRKYQSFFFFGGTMFAILITIALIMFVAQNVQNIRRENREITNMLIAEIESEMLKNLGEEMEAKGSSEVVVNHLKEIILPPLAHPKVFKLWSTAVNTLQKDPRFSFSSVCLGNKNYQTIMWHAGIKNQILNEFGNKWSIPRIKKRVQSLKAVTSYLEIKNMLTLKHLHMPSLKEVLFRALVCRVGFRCKISDIKVGKRNMSVYVRCPTDRDALLLYTELYANSFENRPLFLNFVDLKKFKRRIAAAESNTRA